MSDAYLPYRILSITPTNLLLYGAMVSDNNAPREKMRLDLTLYLGSLSAGRVRAALIRSWYVRPPFMTTTTSQENISFRYINICYLTRIVLPLYCPQRRPYLPVAWCDRSFSTLVCICRVEKDGGFGRNRTKKVH